ncbi:MAG: HepT-like ribonuclease domain-containing protein [Pseudomonadota bacterium]
MGCAQFSLAHPLVRWRGMRDMRDRIVHDDFDIHLDVVRDTV